MENEECRRATKWSLRDTAARLFYAPPSREMVASPKDGAAYFQSPINGVQRDALVPSGIRRVPF